VLADKGLEDGAERCGYRRGLMVDGWLGARPAGNPAIVLVVKSSAAVLCYFATLFLLWTASGRPAGPESDLIQTALKRYA
jgi:hypothetical protein